MESALKAVENRDIEALKNILSYSSSNVLENNISPLMYASYWGLFDVLEVLLSSGADVNMENDFGKSALHFAAISDRAPVIALLCAKGAEVNKPDIDGNTALHRACDWKSQEASKELIKYGADITIANKSRATPLRYASTVKSPSLRKDLVEFIAENPTVDIDAVLELQQRPTAAVDSLLKCTIGDLSNSCYNLFYGMCGLVTDDPDFTSTTQEHDELFAEYDMDNVRYCGKNLLDFFCTSANGSCVAEQCESSRQFIEGIVSYLPPCLMKFDDNAWESDEIEENVCENETDFILDELCLKPAEKETLLPGSAFVLDAVNSVYPLDDPELAILPKDDCLIFFDAIGTCEQDGRRCATYTGKIVIDSIQDPLLGLNHCISEDSSYDYSGREPSTDGKPGSSAFTSIDNFAAVCRKKADRFSSSFHRLIQAWTVRPFAGPLKRAQSCIGDDTSTCHANLDCRTVDKFIEDSGAVAYGHGNAAVGLIGSNVAAFKQSIQKAVIDELSPEQKLLKCLKKKRDILIIESRISKGLLVTIAQHEIFLKKAEVESEINELESTIRTLHEGNLSKGYENMCFSMLDFFSIRECIDESLRRACSPDDVEFEFSSH